MKQQSRAKRKLIGKLDPADGRMKKKKIDATPMLPLTEIKRRFYGATYALGQLAKATGLSKDLKAVFQADYQALLALAYYLVLAPTAPMQKFGRCAELHHLPYDVSVSHLSSQPIRELFQRVTEKEK